MINQTLSEYKQIIALCKDVFMKKNQDYGTAWRILRLPSITDQIFIKAKRIRSIQSLKERKVDEDIPSEFIGIINYCIIGLMQIDLREKNDLSIASEKLSQMYDEKVEKNRNLLANKNHDYGEAWRDMRVSSMTDLILMKIFRIKQIEDNEGKTMVSEGVDSIYQDMINYAVFCLIKSEILQNENN